MRRGGAQREFSLPRSGAERHHACRAQGPPSTGKHESEKGAARQVTVNLLTQTQGLAPVTWDQKSYIFLIVLIILNLN